MFANNGWVSSFACLKHELDSRFANLDKREINLSPKRVKLRKAGSERKAVERIETTPVT